MWSSPQVSGPQVSEALCPDGPNEDHHMAARVVLAGRVSAACRTYAKVEATPTLSLATILNDARLAPDRSAAHSELATQRLPAASAHHAPKEKRAKDGGLPNRADLMPQGDLGEKWLGRCLT